MADYKGITLQKDGGTIECRYAPFTAQRMDTILEASEGYRDTNAEFVSNLSLLTTAPDLAKLNFEGDEDKFQSAKTLADAYVSTKSETAKQQLVKILATKLTPQERAKNNKIHREYIRAMILETTLEQVDLDLVKSDTDSEFWQNQDAFLIKEHGLFFRKQAVMYSE